MNRQLSLGIVVGGVVLLALLLVSSLFTVDQTRQALVTQFGRTVRIVTDPGLNMKLPFVQSVIYIDKRVLNLDNEPQEVILNDQKRLVVDSYARYRITDPLAFFQSVGGDDGALQANMSSIIDSSMRRVLADASLFDVLSAERLALMNSIKQETNQRMRPFGIDVLDVRIRRADLPEQNSQAIYARMQTEREQEARELRAQGNELGVRIRAEADRDRRVLVADAQREAAITRGRGDAAVVGILGGAYGKDPEFFDFFRSLQAYRVALGDGSTNFVLSPDSPFFRYFDPSGGAAPVPAAAAPRGAAGVGPSQGELVPDAAGYIPTAPAAPSPSAVR